MNNILKTTFLFFVGIVAILFVGLYVVSIGFDAMNLPSTIAVFSGVVLVGLGFFISTFGVTNLYMYFFKKEKPLVLNPEVVEGLQKSADIKITNKTEGEVKDGK